jgi:hypothetical protein
MKSDNFWGQMGWGNLLGGLGWCATWIGLGFLVLSMGGCGYLLFHGDSQNPAPLVSVHIHLK